MERNLMVRTGQKVKQTLKININTKWDCEAHLQCHLK